MVHISARLILCLLAGHIFMVIASYNECEPQELARCLKVFTNVIQKADKKLNLVDIYCNGYKEFSQCLASDAECVGNIMDLSRFMALQHTFIDSKLGICNYNDIKPDLRKLIRANEKYSMKIDGLKDLDADKFKPCTARKNLYCVSRLAEQIRNGGGICPSFTEFYSCYESKYMACNDKIYKDYVADVKIGGEKLLQIGKEFPNLFKC